MKPAQIVKQVMAFQKVCINHSLDAARMYQNHTEKIMETMFSHAGTLPEAYQNAAAAWKDYSEKGLASVIETTQNFGKYTK